MRPNPRGLPQSGDNFRGRIKGDSSGATLGVSLSSPAGTVPQATPAPEEEQEPEAGQCSPSQNPSCRAVQRSWHLTLGRAQAPESPEQDPCRPGASCPLHGCARVLSAPGAHPGGAVGAPWRTGARSRQQGASIRREGGWGTTSRASRQKGTVWVSPEKATWG